MSRKNGKHKRKKDENWLTITETVHQSILDLDGIVDITKTMKDFDRLQYEQPPEYTAERIVNLRKNKLHMSQPVFVAACNIKLPTLQIWERGYSKPTPPVNLLFQLVEKGGWELIRQYNENR